MPKEEGRSGPEAGPAAPLEGVEFVDGARGVISRWWAVTFLPWGSSETDVKWSLSWREVLVGVYTLVVAWALVHRSRANAAAVVLLSLPVCALFLDLASRGKTGQAEGHGGRRQQAAGKRSGVSKSERSASAGVRTYASPEEPPVLKRWRLSWLRIGSYNAEAKANASPDDPLMLKQWGASFFGRGGLRGGKDFAREQQPPEERWRTVSIYGVKVRVADDGAGALQVDFPSEGESRFPPPTCDDKETSSTEAPTEPLDCSEDTSFAMGFVRLDQCTDKATGKPELRVTYLGSELNWDEFEVCLNLMDRFTLQNDTQDGFAILYDLRKIGVPPMSVLHRMAQYSSEPSRQVRWKRLNFSNKIVIPGGASWYVAKAFVHLWMTMRPPLTRTWLLTDPDQPEEMGVCWDPPPEAVRAVQEGAAPEHAVPDREPPEDAQPEALGRKANSAGEEQLETDQLKAAPVRAPVGVNKQIDKYLSFIAAPTM